MFKKEIVCVLLIPNENSGKIYYIMGLELSWFAK